jgi:hypothetical protein
MKVDDLKSVVVFVPSAKQLPTSRTLRVVDHRRRPFDKKKLEAGQAGFQRPPGARCFVPTTGPRHLFNLGDEYAKPRPEVAADEAAGPALRAAAAASTPWSPGSRSPTSRTSWRVRRVPGRPGAAADLRGRRADRDRQPRRASISR